MKLIEKAMFKYYLAIYYILSGPIEKWSENGLKMVRMKSDQLSKSFQTENGLNFELTHPRMAARKTSDPRRCFMLTGMLIMRGSNLETLL